MAAWRDRGTWRDKNQRSVDREAADLRPTCPRCADLLEVGARWCPECGCRVTVIHVPPVDDGDNTA